MEPDNNEDKAHFADPQGDAKNRGKVAVLLWGNVIEDFLDTINLSLEDFCERFTGSWVFGCIEALRSAGWQSVLFVVSRRVKASTRLRHAPSGTTVRVLPAWSAYRIVARGMVDPYGASIERVFGPVSRLRRLSCFARRETAPYLATPLNRLARDLRDEGCTAILIQEYEYARFDTCVLLGRVLRLPVYATFQGGDRHTGRLEHLIRPLTLKAARGLVVGADGEALRVTKDYGISQEKIWRIPNPIDVNIWKSIGRGKARRLLGIPPHSGVVIYHGRIDIYRKGLDVLLQAWQQIRARLLEKVATLLIVGSGQDDAILRERLERPELSGVKWIHRFEHDRTAMRRYLSAADLYVLPSRIEGFPVAPLEAMACGLPVIGTDIPAMFNILEHGSDPGGLVVPREDPDALAKAIQGLLENPDLRRKLGRNARRNVEDRFSIESVGRQLGEMLSPG